MNDKYKIRIEEIERERLEKEKIKGLIKPHLDEKQSAPHMNFCSQGGDIVERGYIPSIEKIERFNLWAVKYTTLWDYGLGPRMPTYDSIYLIRLTNKEIKDEVLVAGGRYAPPSSYNVDWHRIKGDILTIFLTKSRYEQTLGHCNSEEDNASFGVSYKISKKGIEALWNKENLKTREIRFGSSGPI